MSNQEVVAPSSNLDVYYTKPNNLVDFFEDSAARFAFRKLFGTKNKTTNEYEWEANSMYSKIFRKKETCKGGKYP